MKELSIEEKAKAYDEAIERAKKVLLDCTSEEQKVVEYITPELKENEDEGIRKALIKFHKSTIDIDGIKGGDILAWLKKQGEKPNNVYDKELSEILGRVIRRYINDPNIPYTEREKVSMEIIPYVERLEKQCEQKSAWSEEDEAKLKSILFHIEDVENKDVIDWLKHLKDRIQPKHKWSEEDENVIEDIEEAIINYWHGDTQDILLDWLKSLRSQSKWKPSEEQLDALHDVAVYVDKSMFPYPKGILMKLYKQLKKLKEE